MPLIAMLLVYGLPMVAMMYCFAKSDYADVSLSFIGVVVACEGVAVMWFINRLFRAKLDRGQPRFRLNWSLESGLLFLCVGWLVSFVLIWLLDRPVEPGSDIMEPVLNPLYFYAVVTILGWIWVVIALIELVGREE